MGTDGEFDVEAVFDDATNTKPDGLLKWMNHHQTVYQNSSSRDIEVSMGERGMIGR